jgi:2-polyprenyl-3-methyl-5-hydroxy-6-metoxy-1,4-benzoquinol methylase
MATQPTTEPGTDADRTAIEAFQERLCAATLGAFTTYAVYLGSRLGYYDALAAAAPSTSVELATATGTNERYTREWLEQQTVSGVLTCVNPDADPGARRFSLPAAHAAVLTDPESLDYLASLSRTAVGALSAVPDIVDAYRTGEGVAFHEFGDDMHEGQAAMNRPLFTHELGTEWLPTLDDIDAKLRAGGRVADVGCGHGWSSIGIARSYPEATVHGIDVDAASIERARENAAASDAGDRLSFTNADAASVEGSYDLVTAFECVHDMSDPVGVLSTMRSLAAPDGTVLVMDERVGESFSPDAGAVEELMYGWSVFHCLPVGMVDDGVGTGTVMRETTLREYAGDAGFSAVDVLPIEDEFFRVYRLTP